jgi:uncharacterized protein (TIGR03083 family)
MQADHGVLYRSVRERVTFLLESLPADSDEIVVPACPAWTVHDLVAHITGVVDDVLGGNADGAGTDPWTAKQVEARRGVPIVDMVKGWTERAPQLEEFVSSIPGGVDPRLIVDIVTHEHDLRGALNRPGARDSDAYEFAAAFIVDHVRETCGVPPSVPDFELVRGVLGRRSRRQVLEWPWKVADPERVVDHVVVFRYRPDDLFE